jgi:hypothetical protein
VHCFRLAPPLELFEPTDRQRQKSDPDDDEQQDQSIDIKVIGPRLVVRLEC